MLRAVRITRPEDKKERLAAFLEHRQEYLCHHIGKITLLLDVRRLGSRYGKSSGLSIRAARRRNERQAGLRHRFNDIGGERYSVRASRRIVNDGGAHGPAVGVIPQKRRTKLSHSRCAVSRFI